MLAILCRGQSTRPGPSGGGRGVCLQGDNIWDLLPGSACRAFGKKQEGCLAFGRLLPLRHSRRIRLLEKHHLFFLSALNIA